MSTSRLFQPIQVGNMSLQHRVVLAPMTRLRTTPTQAPIASLVKEYYRQRASVSGSLLISESTLVAAKAGGLRHAPGIWTEEQISAWKEVAEAVHSQNSYIFLQLAATGRGAKKAALEVLDPSYDVLGPSAIPLTGGEQPRAMTIAEIHEFVQYFATAADNAVRKAGFDGVEIHGANGYLIDQFMQDMSNHRTDEYGGSIENRARFPLEILDAVTKAVGEERVAIRFSPWNTYQDLGMEDPIPQFSYVVSQVKARFPKLAYIHLVESRYLTAHDENAPSTPQRESNDFIRDIWAPKPLISAGGYNFLSGRKRTEERDNELIAFGRYFTSNPDLPTRFKNTLALTHYDRSTFYAVAQAKGYIDFTPAADVIPEVIAA